MFLINLERFCKPLNSVYRFECLISRYRCSISEQPVTTKKRNIQKKFSHTIHLPKTSFPLRVKSNKRVELDEHIFKTCKFAELYKWQRKHVNGPEFILHDGPPYANGKPHMGHAINKILKDITIRNKLLQGHKIHYIPGWDCHGLPIELKVMTKENENLEKLDSINLRHKARELANKAINDQLQIFKSWGIMTDWGESYHTFTKEYIKNQFNQFLSLYNKGLVFRDMKPVFWSPSSRTALAEAELEYNQHHVSTSVTLGLYVVHLPDSLNSVLSTSQKVRVLVWTTTPWTLPANQAVCFHPNMLYCLAASHDSKNEVYLCAVDCLERVQGKIVKELVTLKTFPGELLNHAQYKHPVDENRHLPFLPGLHVTPAMGTGLVHTAPAHGQEDFLVALQCKLPVVNVIDEAGLYTADAGDDLKGLSIFKEGNVHILSKVKHLILHQEDYIHSYPYDWRTKEPVIIRASKQWFIDTDAIKEKALELLHDINVYPKKIQSHSTLISHLQKRPYWCISRQRVWGVPIPVLLCTNEDKPVISRELLDHYNKLLHEHGPDFWWTLPKEIIAPKDIIQAHGLLSSDVEKGKDIMDIWFDSGISWSYVLGSEKQADLYLEGLDQFTGWFQSSLMTSVALRGKSPYKSIFVHGFAVDEFGYKMSKSLGNVVDPVHITHGEKDSNQTAFGMDTLRWWVACHASQSTNIPISQNIMEASASEVHKIRIVSRFLMGAIWDFSDAYGSLPFDNFFSLDLWMLNKLKYFEKEVFALYNSYEYNNVCKIITNFITNEVSSIYCHLIKDRLYCAKKDDIHRRSCQFVMKHTLDTLSLAAAPILPFLMEEVYLHHPCKEKEVLFHNIQKKLPEDWHFTHAESRVEIALKTKRMIDKIHPSNTIKCTAYVEASGNDFLQLKELSEKNELNELLQVSRSIVTEGTSEINVEVQPSTEKQCERCRQFTAISNDLLCHRCEEVLKQMSL